MTQFLNLITDMSYTHSTMMCGSMTIGEEAAQILLDKIINQNASLKEITVKGKLIIRESSMKKRSAIK